MTDVKDKSRICMARPDLSINIANSCWQPFILKGFASCAALWLTGLSCLWQRRKFILLTAVTACILTLLAILVILFLPLQTIPVLRCHPSTPGKDDWYGVRYNTWLLTQYSCSFLVYFFFPFFLLWNSGGPLISVLHAFLNNNVSFHLALKTPVSFQRWIWLPFSHLPSPLHFLYLLY